MGDWKAVSKDWSMDDDVRKRFDAVERLVSGDSILDVGCRSGEFLLGTGKPFKEAIGMDVDMACVDLANMAAADREDLWFECADVTAWDPGGRSFDTVVCMETLEHLNADPREALGFLFSLVRPGGRLLITVPANTHISDPDHKNVFYREALLQWFPDLEWIPGVPHIWIGFALVKS